MCSSWSLCFCVRVLLQFYSPSSAIFTFLSAGALVLAVGWVVAGRGFAFFNTTSPTCVSKTPPLVPRPLLWELASARAGETREERCP